MSVGWQEIAIYGIAAFVPMLVYSFAIWHLDRYEKEPLWMLILAFVWGAAPAVILAVLGQQLTDPLVQTDGPPVLAAAVAAPFWEELAKGVALVLLLVFFRDEIDSVVDGVVFGSLVGFGFSATEDTVYLLATAVDGTLGEVAGVWVLRSYLTGFGHAVYTGLFGIGIALARHGSNALTRRWAPPLGLLAAMVVHGTFNFAAFVGLAPVVALLGPLGLYVIFSITLTVERGWIRRELADEVAAGLLSEPELGVLLSAERRATRIVRTFMDHGLVFAKDRYRFYRAATELAFQKRHRREVAGAESLDARIETLRSRVREIGHRLRGKRLGTEPGE